MYLWQSSITRNHIFFPDASSTPSTVADSQILTHRRQGSFTKQAYVPQVNFFVSNNYTNPNTNPRALTTLTLVPPTLTTFIKKLWTLVEA